MQSSTLYCGHMSCSNTSFFSSKNNNKVLSVSFKKQALTYLNIKTIILKVLEKKIGNSLTEFLTKCRCHCPDRMLKTACHCDMSAGLQLCRCMCLLEAGSCRFDLRRRNH